MDDLISRQAALDAHERIFDRCEEIEAHLPEDDPDRVGYKMYPDWLTVWKYLNRVRSEEPESEERTLTEDDYAYCAECDHVEMCRWYPMYGCEFRSRPSAEPEIIRCKDCKHYKVYNLCKDWKGNTKRCTLSAVATRASDDFCSKAERRTNE